MGPKKTATNDKVAKKEEVSKSEPMETPNPEKEQPKKDAPAKKDQKTKTMKKSLDVKGKKKSTRKETFSSYIYKVLKQVHSDIGISKKSMAIMNSFIDDIFEKIAVESSKLVRYNKKHTLSAREVQTAVKLLLPGELAKHAIIEGAKAVNKIATNTH